jgi:adenosylhomocysteine nucleosidase
VAPAPIPADVGIVAALPVELGFFVDRLRKVRKYKTPGSTVHEGECEGKVVAIVYSGAGRAAARAATELLIDGHRPNLVISAGFAGGLQPSLPRGALLFPSEVVDLDGNRFPVAPLDDQEKPGRPGACRLLTVDEIVRTPEDKASLRESFQADIVDMESSAVATVCRDRGKRLLSIRVISDDAQAELPTEIARMLNRSTSFQVGAAFRAILRRPAAVKDFWRLHAHAIEASDRLAKGLTEVIRRFRG